MKKFIFSLTLIGFSGFAMDNNSIPMTTPEKASLLEAFRCNNLQVKGIYLQFTDIADQNRDYLRSPKDIHEYFKACFIHQKQEQTDKQSSIYENFAELEMLAQLEKKSFVKKIYPDGLMGKSQAVEISQFTPEEQEQILQELLRPSFSGAERDVRMAKLIEPTRKLMLALELENSEAIAQELATLAKVRPEYFVKPLKETLQECAVQ